MPGAKMPNAVVYTETVVHTAPEKFIAEAPYQIAIVDVTDVGRLTVRILGNARVSIGDRVQFAENRDGVPCYRKAE